MSDESSIYDVIIVGGGPAGLSAALLLGRACRRVALVDDGQPRNAAARQVHGYLGRDDVPPHELRGDGRRQLARYDVALFEDLVIGAECLVERPDWRWPTGFKIATRAGRELAARKLLFATGTRDEIPDLPGFKECYGQSVHHCPYCDGWEHRGGRLAAFGGDPAKAAGLGHLLRGWSDKVVVLANGEPLEDQEKASLARRGIRLIEERVLKLVHEDDRLLGVELAGRSVEPTDALFFNTGQRACSDLPLVLGCKSGRDDHLAPTGSRQTTNVEGVFLAGDADGDVQFAIVAAGEGATAAVTINRQLQDEERALADENGPAE
jgi:thioredoxin reductase